MSIITINEQNKVRILNRSPVFWFILLAVLILLSAIVGFFLQHALVKISYSWAPEAREESVQFYYEDDSLDEIEHPVRFSWGEYAFIPRNTQLIYVTSEHSETIQQITNLPLFSIPEFSPTLHPQSKVSKLGSEGMGCNIAIRDRTYTHDCGNTDTHEIIRPPDEAWRTKELPSSGSTNIFSRYRDGFLAIGYQESDHGPRTLQYISLSDRMEVEKTIPLPTDILRDNPNDALFIYTDPINSSGSFIVANLTAGLFFLYDSIEQDEPIATFNRGVEVDPTFEDTTCDLTARQFTCYYGQLTTFHDNLREHREYIRQDDNSWGSLEIWNLDNINNPTLREREIDFGIDAIYQDGNNQIYSLSRDMLMQWNTSTMTPRLVSGRVNTVASASSLFFLRHEGIFEYKSEEVTSYLRFRTPHLIVGDFSSFSGAVLINAFPKTDDNTGIRNIAQIYKLTDAVVKEDERRLEDVLPFGNADDYIGDMDYSDEYIYVAIIPAFKVNPQTGNLEFDQETTEDRRETIRQQLEERNVIEHRDLLFAIYGSVDNSRF